MLATYFSNLSCSVGLASALVLSGIAYAAETGATATIRQKNAPFPITSSQFSSRQVAAIASTHIAGLASTLCKNIEAWSYELGGDLIDAGIQPGDFEKPEFKRIKVDAEKFFYSIDTDDQCIRLWETFGPQGTYGRQLVRLRKAPN
jgi:hypothetical protein